MRGVLTRKGKMYLGHNPGSAYGIFAMLALVLGLAVTGIMLGQGIESVEDLHEILAYVMLAAVGAHVLGVAAALFLLVIGRFLGALIANFDRTTSTTTLPILGTQLRLAETEGEKGENRGLSAVCHGPVMGLSSACHRSVMGLPAARQLTRPLRMRKIERGSRPPPTSSCNVPTHNMDCRFDGRFMRVC